MTELKTLKEIDLIWYDGVSPVQEVEIKKLLRLEAIKRVKQRLSQIEGISWKVVISQEGYSVFQFKKKSIAVQIKDNEWARLGELGGFVDFFNLTEEDLK